MLKTPNEWADFWRNEIGMNCIPADSINKRTWIKWTSDPRGNWQVDSIPLDLHEQWKKENLFKNGIGVVCGKVLHRKDRKHLWLAVLDADNKKGIDCITADIDKLAEKTIVEQHPNNKNKAHIYVYTTKPIFKKSSDYTNSKLAEQMDSNDIPAIELKGEGKHGIMYCTPSPHKDGSTYQILGTKTPVIMDGIEKVVRDICEKYKLGIGNDGVIPMKLLMDPDTKIHEGHNRHLAVMRYAESILRRYPKMTKDEFDGLVVLWNNNHCVPPLSESELEKQKICAVNFISDQIEEEKRLKEIAKHNYGTDEFWTDIGEYKEKFNPHGKFVKCLECKMLIDINPLDKTHYGHKVEIK